MKATPTTRRVFERVNWGASALLVLAIVAMVNWLAFRHYERWDWTSQGIYSMSDRTKKELRALKQDVEVYLFMSEAESNFPEVKELLNRYGAETTRLRVEVVDPDRDPAKYKILAQRFDVATAVDQASGQQFADVAAVVVSGDKRWSVTRDELVGVDVESMDDAAGPKVDVKAEQALTGAIVQVVSGKATKVCLTEGHGEWTSGGEGQARSLRAVETELRRDNIALENIATMGRSAIPAECDALFVVGPLRAFRDEEAKMIRDYVAHGGNALFALDPVIERESITPTGLESVLAEWGIAVDASIVLELSSDRVPPPGNAAGPYFVVDYGEHPIAAALKKLGAPWVARIARSVRSTRDGVVTLAQTSGNAYAETSMTELAQTKQPQRGDGDIDGPVSLAVAAQPGMQTSDVQKSRRGGRVVVFGDSDWLSGELMRPDLANRDLLAAVTGWLTARETLIAIAPKKLEAQRLTIAEADLGDLFWRLLVFIPGAVLVLGLSTWWARRA